MQNRTYRVLRLPDWLLLGLAMAVSSFMPVAMAIEVPELYAAEVPLDPADTAARDKAYRAALNQVLVRITGESDAAASPVFAELFPNPARYVLQYRPATSSTPSLRSSWSAPGPSRSRARSS
jgi:hypothetical protein